MPEEKYSESYYERKLVDGIKQLGGLCWKFVSPGHAGVPDRVIMLPGGTIMFAELKAPGKKERPLQVATQEKMRSLGVTVYSTVDSVEKVNAIVEACRGLMGGGDTL